MNRQEIISLITKKADIAKQFNDENKDLVIVTIHRTQGDDETDEVVKYLGGVQEMGWEDATRLYGENRNYVILNWDWDKSTYGFILKVV